MMQPKSESHTVKELGFAKRFPCQSIKAFHENKKEKYQPLTQQRQAQIRTLYTSAKLRESECELQKDLGTELPPMKIISQAEEIPKNEKAATFTASLGKGAPHVGTHWTCFLSAMKERARLRASRKTFLGHQP